MVFFFPLKTSKTNYSWAQKSSSPTKRCLNWGSAADNVRSVTTVSQNGVSGFHYLQEWRGGESSGAAPASAPTQPRSEPECQEPGNVALLRASFPAAEKLRNGKEQGNSGFSAAPGWLDSLSCPYSKTYSWNSSFLFSRSYYSYPAQFLVICHHTFITTRMKTFSVSLLYSCFASWCCAAPESLSLWAGGKDPDLYHCALSKTPDSEKNSRSDFISWEIIIQLFYF